MSMFFTFAPSMGGGAPPGPSGPLGTWSTTDKSDGLSIVADSGDLIVEMTGYNSVWASIRGNIGKSTGTGYFEANFPGGADGLQFIGLAKSTANAPSMGGFIGTDNDAIGYFGAGVIYRNLTDIALPIPYGTEFVGIEADFNISVARFYVEDTLAATVSLTTLAAPLFPAGSLYTLSRTAVLNCGQNTLNRTPTSGINPYWCADA